MSESKEVIRSNCPRDCYDGCGIIINKVNGNIQQVLGDPDHPVSRGRLCSKCALVYNGVWRDENARLLFPMKRVGAKGEGKFERIDWQEAIDTIATRLRSIVDEQDAQSILNTHYSGTLSLIALEFPMRFFNRLGSTDVRGDTICNAAGHAAWGLLYGESNIGFDPRTAKDSNCILVWGANPSHSAPHAHKHWLPESPAKVVVIDPLRTETAKQADLHLHLRPGTDAALAYSLLHVLKREGMFDEAFIEANTTGVEEIDSFIEAATPQWGEKITGVSADYIEQAARMYGAGPSLLWAGQGLQRQTTGGNIMRAAGLLPALTGNVGKPGTGFYYLNMTPGVAGIDFEALEGSGLAQNEAHSISHMDFADELSEVGKYRALFSWNTNPVASVPNYKQFCKAMQREDLFTVAIDCFHTDTVDYADIVLPAASFLEFDDLTFSYFHMLMGVQAKAQEPMGESLPNQEIFRRLSKVMSFEEEELYESDETLIAKMMQQMGLEFDFNEFKQKGHISIGDEAIIFFDDLKFPTPGGKIEIASAQAEEQGLPRVPQPWADEPSEPGTLRLLTPASNWRMNDSYANDPEIIKRSGPASVTLHPDDAKRFNILENDKVRLYNESGEVELLAHIDDMTLKGVALSYKGRWPKLDDGNHMNVLHKATKTDMGESTSVHSTEIQILVVG
jgi:anaerobic selenocysteine-containing dehydrogenase